VIVADTNLLAYLLIPGRFTAAAERWLQTDPQWAAPRLWRSELRNVMATMVRTGRLELRLACALFEQAEALIDAEEYEVETPDVLRLSQQSGCSAYDCEYLVLAEVLGTRLVTADRKLLNTFPQRTLGLDPG
jgi:predicted nucleic acid-binding protein